MGCTYHGPKNDSWCHCFCIASFFRVSHIAAAVIAVVSIGWRRDIDMFLGHATGFFTRNHAGQVLDYIPREGSRCREAAAATATATAASAAAATVAAAVKVCVHRGTDMFLGHAATAAATATAAAAAARAGRKERIVRRRGVRRRRGVAIRRSPYGIGITGDITMNCPIGCRAKWSRPRI